MNYKLWGILDQIIPFKKFLILVLKCNNWSSDEVNKFGSKNKKNVHWKIICAISL